MHASAPSRARLTAVLTAAVLGISSSAVLVRGMEAEPVAIAAWRTTGAALLLAPASLPALRRLGRPDAVAAAAAGLALAAHFVVWFASLQQTTVLRSTLLVCTTPVWAGAIDALLHRALPRRGFVTGVAVALIGVAILGSSAGGGEASWRGDALAVLGAVLAATYLRLTQSVRQRVGAAATMGLVCAAAAAALWATAPAVGAAMLGYPTATWALLVAAVLGPQLIGHQGFTWAVRWVPASTVAVVILLEPVGAAALAAVFLQEVPGVESLVGGLVVLAGVGVVARADRPDPIRPSTGAGPKSA